MQPVNPFFAIGTVGMIVTAALHMLAAGVIGQPNVHSTFLALYPVSMAFLGIGAGLILRKQ